jgi:probable HAF family extracellular repeat protein
MQDLGTLSGDVASLSISINDAGAVVGASQDANFNPRAFRWEEGVMTDLNTLIAGDSPLYLLTGCSINSRGEITGLGLTSTGEIHTYLATPIDGVAPSESTSQGVISRDSERRCPQAASATTALRPMQWAASAIICARAWPLRCWFVMQSSSVYEDAADSGALQPRLAGSLPLEVFQMFQEEQLGSPLGVIQFSGASGFFAENIVDISGGLFKHGLIQRRSIHRLCYT